MNAWITGLRDVEARLSEWKGEFALFAAFLPAESTDQWDLLVSAPWARRDDHGVLKLIRDELAGSISTDDSLLLARIVVVETWHPDVQTLNSRVNVEHGVVPIANEEHFGYIVERGFIITSKDYWAFIKRLFPEHAEFVFFTRLGSLMIRISWRLNDDPLRPYKRSKNIVLAISEEALEDYLYIDRPERRSAEEKLRAFVIDRLTTFDPHHDTPPDATPPQEQWRVTSALFRHPALAVG
ncbi:MAG: hypothetical protein JO231_24430 [Acidobacteria bacterium]|nr:hypothetical protein [Acidobacteriota bacterium]